MYVVILIAQIIFTYFKGIIEHKLKRKCEIVKWKLPTGTIQIVIIG